MSVSVQVTSCQHSKVTRVDNFSLLLQKLNIGARRRSLSIRAAICNLGTGNVLFTGVINVLIYQ